VCLEVWASIGNVKQTGQQWVKSDHDEEGLGHDTEKGANCGR